MFKDLTFRGKIRYIKHMISFKIRMRLGRINPDDFLTDDNYYDMKGEC